MHVKKGQNTSWEVVGRNNAPKPEGETRPRRSWTLGKGDDLVHRPRESMDTMIGLMEYAALEHGERPFLGTRPLINIHKDEGTGLDLYELGPYEWLSFVEVRDLIMNVVGPALRQIGLGKPEGVHKVAEAPFLSVYSETSLNWRLISMGATSISSPFSTAFSTLDPEGVQHTIAQPGCIAVFTQGELLPKLLSVLPACPTVKTVIYDGRADAAVARQIKDGGIRMLTVEELFQLGRANPAAPTPPRYDDLMAVMYTSGTTSTPKGVEITHAMMMAGVAGIDRHLGDTYETRHDQCHCAFLPLAHAIEQVNSASLWFQGVKAGFGRARTLLSTGTKNCEGDLSELKPTTICAVPLVWETIRKGVELQLSQASPVTRALFNASYFAREHNIPLLAQAGDAVVLSKVRAFTGGRLNNCLSGGAALSESTSQWFRTTGLANIMNGWGLTETLGMGLILHPDIWSPKGHGCIMPCIEVKLVDRPESGYLSTNPLPSGEIYVRGPVVFKAYYKQPEMTAEVFEDGWFMTGDIGRFSPTGELEIVDRVKNLVKLAGGEYVALEKLESVFKACPLVSNLILAAPLGAETLSAVVIPHPANFLTFLKTHHLLSSTSSSSVPQPSSLGDLVNDPKVVRAFLAEINSFGRQAGLIRRELLGSAVLTTDEWTPDNGMVTATFKPKRKAVEEKYLGQMQAANAPRARL